MNMEADGAQQEPKEIPIKPDSDNHEDVLQEAEDEPKINGTKSDIHEEVDLDTLKIEAESASGSESENEMNEIVNSDSPPLENNSTKVIRNEYNEESPEESRENETENTLALGNSSEDVHNECNETSTEEQKNDDVVDSVTRVNNVEDINNHSNAITSLQDENDKTVDPSASEPIEINDSSENFNDDSVNINIKKENSDSDVKKAPKVANETEDVEEAPKVANETEDVKEAPKVANETEDVKEAPKVVNETEDVKAEEPKPVEKMQLRRSSRGIKRKRYDDDGSDIEEQKAVVVNKNKVINKPIMQKNFSNSTANIPNLYQKVLGPNTTLTPISAKNKNITIKNAQNTSQPAILPSLTDDMFVVEAPSFIVPYVYEKPPIEPLKQYIEKLRKQIAEEKAKIENAKENEENDSQSLKTNGENPDDSDGELKGVNEIDELINTDDNTKNEAPAKKVRRNNQDDDESWDENSLSDSFDESDGKEDTPAVTNKSKKIDYFDLTLGKFFSKIGLNLVKKYVQTDLLKQQTKKLSREKRTGQISKATQLSILSLKKNLAVSEKKNAPYMLEQHKCQFCVFKSDSRLALAHHLETPHMKNNMYQCNFCKFEVKSPHDILYHMESQHGVRAKLERAPAYHQCPNCPFEDNGKGKLARHQIACAKRFKPDLNLAPPFEWEPPAKILMARAKAPIMNPYQYNFNRTPIANNHIGKPIINNMIPGANNFRARIRAPVPIPRSNAVQGISILRGGATIRPSISSSTFMQSNFPSGSKTKISNTPSISITPLPRQVQMQQRQTVPPNKDSCVICEICDGYIKDLEQLRSHMQWIHRVKIHPKMMTNSPPLNCQKCQLRFFTDQGLERHLLGSHGLVTKSMQEEANKGNDGGRCPICGRVYQWKLLDHVGRDHKMTLKPAHLSYKCTVCSAIFGLYKQFENHVYSAHSVVAKRVMNKGKNMSQTKIGNSILKPLRNREDLTITPSSGRPLVSSDEEK